MNEFVGVEGLAKEGFGAELETCAFGLKGGENHRYWRQPSLVDRPIASLVSKRRFSFQQHLRQLTISYIAMTRATEYVGPIVILL